MTPDQETRARAIARAARRAGSMMAATAIFWILATAIGVEYELSQRVRALLDLIALAGFGAALAMTWAVWRLRRADKG